MKKRKSSAMCYRVSNNDRVKIIHLVKKGYSTDEIREKFSYEYTKYQIAAIRAWVTMGNY